MRGWLSRWAGNRHHQTGGVALKCPAAEFDKRKKRPSTILCTLSRTGTNTATAASVAPTVTQVLCAPRRVMRNQPTPPARPRYSATLLGLQLHLASIQQLCRVAGEVRVFPLVGQFGAERSMYVSDVFMRVGYRGPFGVQTTVASTLTPHAMAER